MADYIFYYVRSADSLINSLLRPSLKSLFNILKKKAGLLCRTFLLPMLVLLLSLCVLRYCCKHCRKDSLSDSNLEPSTSQHIYVIPNPVHFREDPRGERESGCEDSEVTPPPYELVYPPPSYAEASFKVDISGVQVPEDSVMDVPPPPYSPPLNHFPESPHHQH